MVAFHKAYVFDINLTNARIVCHTAGGVSTKEIRNQAGTLILTGGEHVFEENCAHIFVKGRCTAITEVLVPADWKWACNMFGCVDLHMT